jgi:predicted TPR repeat methyltransferase
MQQDDIEFDGSIRGIREANKSLRDAVAADRLTWWPEIGIGYYPVTSGTRPYNQAYFDRFAEQANTDIGRALMHARCDFVERHFHGTLVDVGIGSGAFINAMRRRRRIVYGYDVNPAAVAWLEERGLFVDPHIVPMPAITLWDVLEHIDDFRSLLCNVKQWVFVSLPIFADVEHVRRSKHFRRDEHFWYFTHDGLIAVMRALGFDLIEATDVETRIGREDIMSYAFKRGAS